MKKNKSENSPDVVLKDFWRNNSRFADLFNQVLFHGNLLIKPDKLMERDTEASSLILKKDGTEETIARTRDIFKQYTDGIDFVLVGLENQLNTHYAMPVRNMTYEGIGLYQAVQGA